eukprot:m.38003 g.38003  ORF g.38003 m.38003 type:complete len:457 (+) comp12565_c0_seq2:252-1622(+)
MSWTGDALTDFLLDNKPRQNVGPLNRSTPSDRDDASELAYAEIKGLLLTVSEAVSMEDVEQDHPDVKRIREETKRTFTQTNSSLKQALLELLVQQIIPYLLSYANGTFLGNAKDIQSRFKASEASLRDFERLVNRTQISIGLDAQHARQAGDILSHVVHNKSKMVEVYSAVQRLNSVAAARTVQKTLREIQDVNKELRKRYLVSRLCLQTTAEVALLTHACEACVGILNTQFHVTMVELLQVKTRLQELNALTPQSSRLVQCWHQLLVALSAKATMVFYATLEKPEFPAVGHPDDIKPSNATKGWFIQRLQLYHTSRQAIFVTYLHHHTQGLEGLSYLHPGLERDPVGGSLAMACCFATVDHATIKMHMSFFLDMKRCNLDNLAQDQVSVLKDSDIQFDGRQVFYFLARIDQGGLIVAAHYSGSNRQDRELTHIAQRELGQLQQDLCQPCRILAIS